jgi:hypothetical protein
MSSLTLLCYRALLASSREYTDHVIAVIVVRIIILQLYLHYILTSFNSCSSRFVDCTSGSETERCTRWSIVVKRTLRIVKDSAHRVNNKQPAVLVVVFRRDRENHSILLLHIHI